MLAGDERSAATLEAVRPARVGLWRTPAWPHAEPATVRAVETAAAQLARNGVAVDEIELPAEFERFLDAQSDVLRFEAARVFAFERTQRAELLSPSSRKELAAGAAIPRQRYREAQALIARCRALFAAAIAPFDLLLSASAPGEAPAGLDNTGEATFNRWGSGLLVPCINLPGFTGPSGLPVGVQLMGAIDDDFRLLCAAKWIAAHIGEAAGDAESRRSPRFRRSEIRPDGADDAVAVVDGRQPTPFVERRAGMRKSATDEVADTHFVTERDLQVGVLIVELAHPPGCIERHAYSVPNARERHRQIDIERRVAFAERQDCKPGLRL